MNSFENLESWINDVKTQSNPDIKIFLIGNKADLEDKREVTKEMGEKFCSEHNLNLFMETSAKTGFNAENLLMKAAILLYEDYLKNKDRISRPGSLIDVQNAATLPDEYTEENEEKTKKKGCQC